MMPTRNRYAAHAAHFVPAQRRSEPWRLIVGAVMIVAAHVGLLYLLLFWLKARYGALIAYGIVAAAANGATPGAMLLLLYSFLGLGLAAFAVVRLLHDRSAATLFGGGLSPAVRDFLRVIGPLAVLQLLLLAFALGDPAVLPGLDPARFVAFLPFALPAVLVQTAAEELFFRGYLQQQLAARFRSPLVWMVLPSTVFALLHFDPSTFGAQAWLVAGWTAVFGILAADLTARTGNLGAAIAFHFANNVFALLLVAMSGVLDGLSLWRLDLDGSDSAAMVPVLVVDLLAMVVAWLVIRARLRV